MVHDGLVKRLRERQRTTNLGVSDGDLMRQAADLLEQQAARIAKLEAALKPLARAEHIVATIEPDGRIRCTLSYPLDATQTFTLALLNEARAALGQEQWTLRN